ncbi:hypothetical protein [Piscirickettsia litoralis]|uniref:Uncharacterized protein n=1 Tax=Piscirickettsia litoralis TaxID=1891921 RepID=A0ABX3A8A8_9GAMM|nr:hypothetical protein [Piscirickettsia litoralis]ODN43883.1 hypothetical protein BGC07_14535 [Piscirickettsia litoralis]
MSTNKLICVTPFKDHLEYTNNLKNMSSEEIEQYCQMIEEQLYLGNSLNRGLQEDILKFAKSIKNEINSDYAFNP